VPLQVTWLILLVVLISLKANARELFAKTPEVLMFQPLHVGKTNILVSHHFYAFLLYEKEFFWRVSTPSLDSIAAQQSGVLPELEIRSGMHTIRLYFQQISQESTCYCLLTGLVPRLDYLA
jgi:hypothetical protein